MEIENNKNILDYIKKVAPGTSIRNGIDNILNAGIGALIVFDCQNLYSEKLFEGGFRLNCRFTPEKLFELAKMDGAMILSSDLKRIMSANVLITPKNNIPSDETGTRHQAAERCAKQGETFVIAISERKRVVSLYYKNSRYILKYPNDILSEISTNLQVLEKQRELFNNLVLNLDLLEVSDMISTVDVCKVIQKAEMILKISEYLKKSFMEAGKNGTIMNMRYKELLRNVESIEKEVIRDYSILTHKKTKTILSNMTLDGMLNLDSIARLIIEKDLEEEIPSKGYRFLSHLKLNDKDISLLVRKFIDLKGILSGEINDFEEVLKNRAESIKNEIALVRENILSGKSVF